MKITKAWIERYATQNGGWTRKQLAAIGVSWPPPKGWKAGVIGREVSDEQRRAFESREGEK